jgi:hypothetical protein
MWGNLKYANDALNHTTPNKITMNQIMRSQTMACINKSSCEISVFLRYSAVLSGNSLQMFQYNLLVPPSSVKNSKKATHVRS